MSETTKKVTVWRESEWAHVIHAARMMGPPERGDSQEVWRKMQEGLAPERRRAFDGAHMAKINAERRKGRPKDGAPAAPAAPASPAVAIPATPPAEEAVGEVGDAPVASVAIPAQPLAGLADVAAKAIVEALLQVLYEPSLRQAARDLIKEVVAPETKEQTETGVLWRTPVAGQEKRRRVVIAAGGKFAENATQTLRPLMRFYDFRFWNSRQEHAHKLKAILQGADAAVLVTNSVSHSGADACRAWARNNRDKMLIQYTRNVASFAEDLPGLLGDDLTIKGSKDAI